MSSTRQHRTERRAKHIGVKYHATRDRAKNIIISLTFCPTATMIADLLTKPISKTNIEWRREQLELSNLSGDISLLLDVHVEQKRVFASP
jgi:hypothetical protein